MTRILSGIKPTGNLHIGNYLGAMKTWASYQNKNNEVWYFIADLHSLNTRQDPELLRARTLDLAAWLFTVGIDPHESTVFLQSSVSAHSELCWILNNYTTMGELSRMTQYKDKITRTSDTSGQLVGLFDYPVLMTADILLYDAHEVPVGSDQKQHVELSRNIAQRFNNLYGEVFVLPEAIQVQAGTRVMSLQDPTKKMSKSDNDSSYILLLDNEEEIRNKVKRAVTDSEGIITYNKQSKPAISNLLEIYAAFSAQTIDQVVQQFENSSYGVLKDSLAQLIVKELGELQVKYHDIRSNEDDLVAKLAIGNQRATQTANSKLRKVKEAIGLLT